MLTRLKVAAGLQACNWGAGVAAAYLAFAAATTGVVIFAMHRPVDLVSPDYYAQELRQDDRAAAIANAARLGPSLGLEVTRRALRLRLPAAQAASAHGSIHLYRASNAADDREFAIALEPGGRQLVALSGVAPGEWTVKVEWSAGGRHYYFEQDANLQ